MESDVLTIGRLRKVWGRRGELAMEVLTDFPDRFQPGEHFCLRIGNSLLEYNLQEARPHKGLLNLKFEGIDDISSAEKLVGATVEIAASERRELQPGEVYFSDLLGCEVFEDGVRLGTVAAVEQTGAAPLVNVATGNGELLIPFVEAICIGIDIARKRLDVKLPEGLLELNRGS